MIDILEKSSSCRLKSLYIAAGFWAHAEPLDSAPLPSSSGVNNVWDHINLNLVHSITHGILNHVLSST